MDLQLLKAQTAVDHNAVENAVSLMRPGLTVVSYLQCLHAMYGMVSAWEERALEVTPDWLRPALIARQRKTLLEQDLAWFGSTVKEHDRPVLPAMNNLTSLLGSMYVMEGSALGGQFIARHVEAVLPLNHGQGSSYFRGHGSQTGPLWKEFCEMLKLKVAEEDADAVIFSAKAMFRTFGSWMQRKSAVNDT